MSADPPEKWVLEPRIADSSGLTTASGRSAIGNSHLHIGGIVERQEEEKTAEPETSLPKPELNPLLNPTLGHNLGRWAQVYLTTPPEQREHAIAELLRELEAEPESTPPAITAQPPNPATEPKPPLPLAAAPISSICQECGHHSLPDARFCGSCGASLMNEEALLVDAPQPAIPSMGKERRLVDPPEAPISLPSFEMASETVLTERTPNIDWLRERALVGGSSDLAPAHHWRYTLAALAVLLVGGVFLYLRMSGGTASPAHSEKPPAIVQNQGVQTEAPSPPVSASSRDSQSSDRIQPSPSPATPPVAVTDQNKLSRPPSVDRPIPSTTPGPPAKAPTPAASASDGSLEVAAAHDYLDDRKGPRNPDEAARLLWKAVGKQNDAAILLLSDMYKTGDGVTQSCDQARLLLEAAARRNVHAAAERLRSLQTSCP